jgi:lysophospholipase L1-like esterase
VLKSNLIFAVVLAAPAATCAAAENSALIEGFERWKPAAAKAPPGWKIVDPGGKGRLKMVLGPSKEPHGGKVALRVESKNRQRFKAPGFVAREIAPGSLRGSAGISFWVRGDGSKYYASVVLGVEKGRPLLDGYEALFPLSDAKWHKVTLRWSDFVQNTLPWAKNKGARFTAESVKLDPARVTRIGFGHGRYFFDYDAAYSLEIDDVRLEKSLSARKAPEKFSAGLGRTAALLKAGKPVKILALGDSITWRGKKRSYAHLLGGKLKEKFRSEVTACNRGIAGYSARGGAISLPRDVRAMPDPDLVLVFFGANDCKAAKLGVTPQVFAAHLGDLVDRVRVATGGRADVMILSGVPRGQRAGEPVSSIVKGAAMAAKQKQAAFCDSYPVFKKMPAAEHKKCCPDGLHFSAAGQRKMAELVFARVCELVGK